ncbi:MAG TPA: 4Fe-4S binding protein [Elusimicrobiales bacterium]|nr:4Fe-4S binding protein [Elusimicrobiales bacterium]
MKRLSVDREKLLLAGLFALLVFIPVLYFSGLIAGRELSRGYAAAWALLAAATAFAIAYTGRVAFFRRIFFGVSALAFLGHFKAGLLFENFEASCFTETPFCHIAIAPAFLNYLYQQYLAVMSAGWKAWGPFSLGAAWLFFTLALGRGWCSWACFYGGIDDALSARPGKPLLKIDRFALKFRDLPAALLVFLLLASFSYMLPVYCLWLCPFKLTGAFLDGDAAVRKLQYGLMGLSLAVLVLGPLLTGKRTFCSFLCPFGAWQALWGRLNPLRVSVDAAKCSGCLVCTRACPMSAIRCAPGGKPEILAYCNLCGQCLEACPGGGFRYTVFGLDLPERDTPFGQLLSVKYFYVFSALTLAAVFSALWGPAALSDILRSAMP